MSEIQTIITADPSGEKLVQFAETTADQLVRDNLTRGQIRNVFTEVRKIEALWDTDPEKALRRLTMLKPKLDYQAARMSQVKRLKDVLSEAIDWINKAEKDKRTEYFQRFVNLFEALLAYHRSKGGKN